MAGVRRASSAALLVAVVIVAAAAAAGAFTLCGVDRSAVAACRPYCQVRSQLAAPSPACCAMVKGAQWQCLCDYKEDLPSDIDPARVMSLATLCKCDYPAATCAPN